MDSQPLSKSIWDDRALENFKPPSLVSFNGKIDPREHIISIDNQIEIVGAFDSLKYKNIVDTKEEVARHKK